MESNKIGAATAFATVLFLIVRSERKQSSYSITFQFLSLSLSLTHITPCGPGRCSFGLFRNILFRITFTSTTCLFYRSLMLLQLVAPLYIIRQGQVPGNPLCLSLSLSPSQSIWKTLAQLHQILPSFLT